MERSLAGLATRQVSGDQAHGLVTDALGLRCTVTGWERPRRRNGLSVYAVRGPGGIAAVMERFRQAPMVAVVTAGVLRRAGVELVATGSNPDHYDVQLLPGWLEELAEATHEQLHVVVARFLDVAGPLHPNPAYADDVEDRR